MLPPKSTTDWTDPTGFHTLEIISRATAFNRWMYEQIKPYLQGSVLEIGSGIGNISHFLVDAGYTISLSDYDPAYRDWLTARYKDDPNVQEVLSIDLEHPYFHSTYARLQGAYDTVFLLNVIEHIRDDQKAIAYCASLLKPGGRLIVLAPAIPALYSGLDKELGHHRRYTRATLTRLLGQEGLRIVYRQYFNVLGLAGWFCFGKIAGRKQLTGSAFNLFNTLVPLARALDGLFGRLGGLSVIAVAEKKI
ncbi:MAG: class I SAM-dependent methyltransferase [Williamsia sp.]|nr:class I SAM-dependent methyltransferase [Williamsia sp.]